MFHVDTKQGEEEKEEEEEGGGERERKRNGRWVQFLVDLQRPDSLYLNPPVENDWVDFVNQRFLKESGVSMLAILEPKKMLLLFAFILLQGQSLDYMPRL